MNYFLISNMYPSHSEPGYGSFVKNICLELEKYNFVQCQQALIVGKSLGVLSKIRKYVKFYLDVVSNYFKKYEFIYLHFPNQAIPILYLLEAIRRRKIIINFHGEDLMYETKGYSYYLGKLMERFCKKFAMSIVVPSEYFKQEVIKRNLISPNKIIVSPSGGINKEYFYYLPKDNNQSKIHIGYVGRLEDGKGYLEFVNVCKDLSTHADNIPFKATIIGYGSKKNEVIEFLKINNLQDKVSLIDGIPQTKIGDWYREFDIFIFSSSRKAESLGLTGIEAMACGVPVIGSDVGGIKSYLKDNYNGWLVPQHDIKSIVQQIKKFTAMTSIQKRCLRNNCYNTAQNYYSDLVGKQLAEKFSLMLSNV